MASFGTSLAEAFGIVETLDNQEQEQEKKQEASKAFFKKVGVQEASQKDLCSPHCQKLYREHRGSPPKHLKQKYCSRKCVNVSDKILKELPPPTDASETAVKEGFTTFETMHPRHPRPGPPHHGPMRPRRHHGDRSVEIIQEIVPSVIFRNVRKNLDLVLVLIALIVLLVVGLVVMKK